MVCSLANSGAGGTFSRHGKRLPGETSRVLLDVGRRFANLINNRRWQRDVAHRVRDFLTFSQTVLNHFTHGFGLGRVFVVLRKIIQVYVVIG